MVRNIFCYYPKTLVFRNDITKELSLGKCMNSLIPTSHGLISSITVLLLEWLWH